MLDTEDKNWIKKAITDAFAEFYESIFAPYVERNEIGFKELRKEVREGFEENSKDHEQVFRKLKQNQEEHDEMFVRFDRIDAGLKDHEKRIKKIERIVVS